MVEIMFLLNRWFSGKKEELYVIILVSNATEFTTSSMKTGTGPDSSGSCLLDLLLEELFPSTLGPTFLNGWQQSSAVQW